MFAAGTLLAGEHGECTKKVGNAAKPACTVSLASLNLTPDQKTKMDVAMAEHQKAGCSEASEAKYMQEAKKSKALSFSTTSPVLGTMPEMRSPAARS